MLNCIRLVKYKTQSWHKKEHLYWSKKKGLKKKIIVKHPGYIVYRSIGQTLDM
jgi:hypothetical protein